MGSGDVTKTLTDGTLKQRKVGSHSAVCASPREKGHLTHGSRNFLFHASALLV